MSAHDQRQYRQMLYILERIERGNHYSIPVADLTVLVSVLEASDPDWESAVHDGIGELDQEFAFAATEAERDGASHESYDEAAVNRMRTTAARLKQMVLAKIEASADGSQGID